VNIIKCKNCGQELEITEAIEHQIIEAALVSEREKHRKELDEIQKKADATARTEMETVVKRLQQDAAGEKERNKKLQEQLLELTNELRKARQEKDDAKLEMQKQLVAEESKIREETRKKSDEEHRLKDAEKDKKLQDAIRVNEELRRKLEQGSQQTQGEVLELELEELLGKEFPEDKVTEIKKGERGADVNQTVIDKLGRECGSILWESKNAQWSDGWLKKLREDQRAAKAQLSVLVVANPPDSVETYTYLEGVWVTTRQLVVPLAFALRFDLIHLHQEKLSNVGKNEKMEVLYQYLRSAEFRHRIEAVVEAFNNLQLDIEKEKRWFTVKWARQEKELRKIIDNTHGIYGELQAVTGRELQQIKTLELPSGEDQEEEK